jgi:predicted ATPase
MLYHAAVVHQLRREGQLTQTRAEAVIALSSEQEFALFFAVGTVLRGWALAEQGQAEEGIAHIRQGLAAYRVTGAELGQPYILALLAEAYGNVGQTEEGLSALAEALALVNKTQERWWEAELYRLKGELLRRQAVGAGVNPIPMEASQWAAADGGATGRSPLLSEAEGCFQRALDVARHRQAKPLELRAAMSLGRLWQRQGRRQEAQQLVAGIYDWFTEGFDTADLREAKARLGELS